MADEPLFCSECGEELISTHAVLTLTFTGGSPFKNAATRRLAQTFDVPEVVRLCIKVPNYEDSCAIKRGKGLRGEE